MTDDANLQEEETAGGETAEANESVTELEPGAAIPPSAKQVDQVLMLGGMVVKNQEDGSSTIEFVTADGSTIPNVGGADVQIRQGQPPIALLNVPVTLQSVQQQPILQLRALVHAGTRFHELRIFDKQGAELLVNDDGQLIKRAPRQQ